MIRRLILALMLINILSLLCPAQAKTTSWLNTTICIDGSIDDWNDYPRTHMKDLGLSYSIANDGEYLYVLVQKRSGYVPGMNRVRVWINAENVKKKVYGFVLQGPAMPLPAMPSRLGMAQRMQMMPRQQMQLSEGLYFLDYETSLPREVVLSDGSAIQMCSRIPNPTVTMYELRIPLAGSDAYGVPSTGLQNGKKFRIGFECIPPMEGMTGPGSGMPGGGGSRDGMSGRGGGIKGSGRPGGGPPAGRMDGEMPLMNPETKWVKIKLADQG